MSLSKPKPKPKPYDIPDFYKDEFNRKIVKNVKMFISRNNMDPKEIRAVITDGKMHRTLNALLSIGLLRKNITIVEYEADVCVYHEKVCPNVHNGCFSKFILDHHLHHKPYEVVVMDVNHQYDRLIRMSWVALIRGFIAPNSFVATTSCYGRSRNGFAYDTLNPIFYDNLKVGVEEYTPEEMTFQEITKEMKYGGGPDRAMINSKFIHFSRKTGTKKKKKTRQPFPRMSSLNRFTQCVDLLSDTGIKGRHCGESISARTMSVIRDKIKDGSITKFASVKRFLNPNPERKFQLIKKYVYCKTR